MNVHTTKALFLDALAQVLDNKIFRLLVILTGGLVLPTFLIAATPEKLVLLWGWREYDYTGIFEALNQRGALIENPREALIGTLQTLFVNQVAGTVGIFFTIAATAFFVPRMLEKGAADTLFSKPVSRLTLLLTRYLAGLLFVGVLAVILVGGIHLGLMLNSGYSDPGFLWSIPSLIYLFAVLYAVSILCGVLTRSSAAAILITIVFFMFNGCVHGIWRGIEYSRAGELERALNTVRDEAAGADAELADLELPEAEPSSSIDTFKNILFGFVDTLHYTLPKTGDVKLIATMLRKSIETEPVVYADEELNLEIRAHPDGFLLEDPGAPIDGAGLVWRSEHGTRGGDARFVLRRFSRLEAREVGDDRPPRKRTTFSIARDHEGAVEDDPRASDVTRDVNGEMVSQIPVITVTWTETTDAGRAYRKTYFWSRADWIYELDVRAPEEWIEDAEARAPLTGFLDELEFEDSPLIQTPGDWYESRFDWDAPWKYNAFFSMGTTAGFALVVLALAWIRLARIDF